MKFAQQLGIEFGHAICSSGYRKHQSPILDVYPSYQQVVEDLKLLQGQWQYLRIYDCSRHADLVLSAIRNERLNFKVMLGADVAAEMQSPDCPWLQAHPEHQLEKNRVANDRQIKRLIELANEYPEIVFSLSIGNEASVDWSDHRVPLERLIEFARRIKQFARQPVTFCENYVPWLEHLKPLVQVIDFISVHSYPVWEYQTIEGALRYTKQNYKSVASLYPDKPVVITEAGWTTRANGRGIDAWNASQEFQAQYYSELMDWSVNKKILTFVFEAFDEPWKSSDDPDEPEKHWGLFTVDRQPKLAMQELYGHRVEKTYSCSQVG